MLSCKEVSKRASALVDGDLGRFESLQIRMHLLLCTGCAQFIEQVRVTRDLSMIPPEEPSLATSDQVKIDALMTAAKRGKPPV